MASHRTKERRKLLRSVVFECVSGFSVTFQNSGAGWAVAWPIFRANTEFRSAQSTRATPPLVLDHFEHADFWPRMLENGNDC
jgi:hypothetical protein